MIRAGWKKQVVPPEDGQYVIRTWLGRRSIVMIGLMGCGKSSVGRRLAAAISVPFIDADDAIEEAAHMTIPEIFAAHGEAYFRNGERRVIARLLAAGPQVVATGGGAYMDAGTRANIRASGYSIWLKAEMPVLMRRVMKRDNRPLLKTGNPEAIMRNLMEQRYPVYADADLTIESRDVAHEVVVADIVSALTTRAAGSSTTGDP